MAEPKIFTRNYLDGECVVTVTSGDGSKANLYDRDYDSIWQTSGQDDDSDLASIIVEFYEGGVAQTRTLDSLFLLNHNFETWEFFYWDGSAWVSHASELLDTSEGNTFKSFASISTTKIKINVTNTYVTDAEKFMGELILCALQFNIGTDVEASYNQTYRQLARETVLGDGSIHRMVTRWAQNRTQKYEAQVQFKFLTSAQRDALYAIAEAGEPFLWQPESVTRVQDVFYVHWSNTWNVQYSSTYKGSGYDINLVLKEV